MLRRLRRSLLRLLLGSKLIQLLLEPPRLLPLALHMLLLDVVLMQRPHFPLCSSVLLLLLLGWWFPLCSSVLLLLLLGWWWLHLQRLSLLLHLLLLGDLQRRLQLHLLLDWWLLDLRQLLQLDLRRLDVRLDLRRL